MNEVATASDSPLIQGRNARLYGKARDACPYAAGTPEHQAWTEAYDGHESLTTGPQPDDDTAGSRG